MNIDLKLDLESIANNLVAGIINLGKAQLSNYLPQVESDAKNVVNTLKSHIEIWVQQLKNGDITKDDLDFLIAGSKEYLAIAALTQAGIAQVQLDQFKQGVVNLIVNTLTTLIP